MQLRILSADDVRRALPMSAAVAGMKDAYRIVSAHQAEMPPRIRIDNEAANGVSLFMPSYVKENDSTPAGILATKTVTIYNDNPQKNLPTINAVVQLLDAETGVPLAILEGATLTAIRTGAGSGTATDVLARSDSITAGIFGSGVQAKTQLEAVCTVREIEQVFVYSRNSENAARFAADVSGAGQIPEKIQIADSPQQLVQNSDIICTATTSATPVFDGNDLNPGTHINAVGSFQPHVQEIDETTLLRSIYIADERAAVLEEPGDFLIPLANGTVTADHIQAELGEIIAGQKPGRTDDDQITMFKTCGLAVQDAVAAQIAYETAVKEDLGTVLDL